MRIAVLLACHNRRLKTLACLGALDNQALPKGTSLSVFLADAGSTDGTSECVRLRHPRVHVVPTSPDLFWNGGMRVAWSEALREDFDSYLWLNDDTHLEPDAVARLIFTLHALPTDTRESSIVVGSTRDPLTGMPTYGGVVRSSRIHPLKYRLLTPGKEAQQCETMNGNCVLVTREVARRAGNLGAEFTHGIGDFDYGLRARAEGCTIWVVPGFIGTCPRNPLAQRWGGGTGNLRQRWQRVDNPKGLPFWEYRAYAQKHGGPLWPVFWLLPYLRFLAAVLRPGK